jgi:hypothetical protein
MPPNIPPVYIIYRNVTGKTATEADFIRRLKEFSSSALLRICSVLNIVLTQLADGYDEESHDRLVRTFFHPTLANALLATHRPVFHRHQLLFVAQEALRHCEVTLPSAVSLPKAKESGTLMLMASELLASLPVKRNSPSEELARRISSILPDMETNGPSSYNRKMARSLAMCTRFADQLHGTKNHFDIRKLFREATQLDLDIFYALVFGCFSRFLNLKEIKASLNLADYAVGPHYFRKCAAIASEDLDRFFAYMSSDAANFTAEVRAKNPHRNEFTILRNKPLFNDGGLYRPLDLSMLADKMESGVFWSVNGQVDAKIRDQFHVFWGEVFERYVSWLMGSSVDGEVNKFLPNPRYLKKGLEVCDGIVVSGTSAILIECKGSTLTAKGKYGGDASTLDAELQKKFVGTAATPKGVRQLVDAIQKLFGREAHDQVSGIDLGKIENVIPVLLTRDDIGSAFNISAYLNFHFQELIRGTSFTPTVSPLCAVSVNDFEQLAPYLVDVSLSEILLARLNGDKDLIFPLWLGDNAVLNNVEPRPSPLLTAEIEKLGEICRVRLGLPDDESLTARALDGPSS